jgi:hypothetical protein
MKVGGAGEKGACPMRVRPQTRKINNPFLAVFSSFLLDIRYLILCL